MNNNRSKGNKNRNVWKNGLSLVKFLAKTRLLNALEEAANKTKANKFVKKYDRGKLIGLFLIAIIIGSNSYRLEIEDSLNIALLVGQNGVPAKSTISKTWGKLLDTLYNVYNHYTSQLRDRAKPIYELVRDVLIVDIKAIETKNRHAKLGYIHRRLKKGLKLHMSTLNSSPWIFFLTPANEHDSRYIDTFAKIVAKKDDRPIYIVADRAFSALERIAEFAKKGVYLITPYKRNMRGFKPLKSFRAGDLSGFIRYRTYNGVMIFLIEAYDYPTHKTWLILTPVDDPELAVRLYRARWGIEVLFKNLSTLGFRLLGHSYEAITASVLLFLTAYVLLRLYAAMLNRKPSIRNFSRSFYKWFYRVFKGTVYEHITSLKPIKPPPRQQVREVLNWLKGHGANLTNRLTKAKNG